MNEEGAQSTDYLKFTYVFTDPRSSCRDRSCLLSLSRKTLCYKIVILMLTCSKHYYGGGWADTWGCMSHVVTWPECIRFKRLEFIPDVVAYFMPVTPALGFWVQGQTRLHSKILSFAQLAPLVKVLASSPDVPVLIPRTHMMETLPNCHVWTVAQMHVDMCVHTYT